MVPNAKTCVYSRHPDTNPRKRKATEQTAIVMLIAFPARVTFDARYNARRSGRILIARESDTTDLII